MERWLYAYRYVRGDVATLEESLRGGLMALLGDPSAQPDVDGSFLARLHADVAGLDAAKQVRVHAGVAGRRGARLWIPIAWEAEPGRRAFPRFDGAVELEPLSSNRAQLTLTGRYRPPFGPFGAVADGGALRVLAQDSAEEVVERLCEGLSTIPPTKAEPREQPSSLTVADVMTTDPLVVEEDLPLRTAALLLFHHGIGGAPVAADDGSLLGVISEADLLGKEAEPPAGGRFAELHDLRARARTVGEACSRPARVTVPGAALRAAVRVMIDERVARLVVVDGSRIVGIVTRHDVLRALIRADAVIEAAVADVLAELDEPEVTARVQWGIVELEGHARVRSHVSNIHVAVAAVDGVIAVDGELGWRADDVVPFLPPLA